MTLILLFEYLSKSFMRITTSLFGCRYGPKLVDTKGFGYIAGKMKLLEQIFMVTDGLNPGIQ